MKKNLKVGIILMMICTLFTSTGQYFFKYSSADISFSVAGILSNWPLIVGFLCYGLGSVLLIIALKFGDLSKLYPFVSLNFIWVTLLSVFVLGEAINNFKINAIVLVVFGVILIGGSG